MISSAITAPRGGTWTSRIDAIGKLIGWLRPSTTGRSQALARLEQLRTAIANGQRFSTTLAELSRDLDAVYPGGAVVTLARKRVRALLLAIDRQR
jgi:hypothetical protein